MSVSRANNVHVQSARTVTMKYCTDVSIGQFGLAYYTSDDYISMNVPAQNGR